MGLLGSSKEPTSEKFLIAVDGMLSHRLRMLRDECRDKLSYTNAPTYYAPATDISAYAQTLSDCMQDYGRGFADVYESAFYDFHLAKISRKLEKAIREHFEKQLESLVQAERADITKFAQKFKDPWPWTTTENSFYAMKTYANGRLETMLHTLNNPQKQPKVKKEKFWTPVKLTVLPLVLTGVGYLFFHYVIERGERLAERRRELFKELSPQITACGRAVAGANRFFYLKDKSPTWQPYTGSLPSADSLTTNCEFLETNDVKYPVQVEKLFGKDVRGVYYRYAGAEVGFHHTLTRFFSSSTPPTDKQKELFKTASENVIIMHDSVMTIFTQMSF